MRIHIPVVTNDAVDFRLNGVRWSCRRDAVVNGWVAAPIEPAAVAA